MCGIAGIVALDEKPVDARVLQQMTDLLSHRGPDGAGFMLASGPRERRCHSFTAYAGDWSVDSPVRVGLGHRRLAILDLSDRGAQPMHAPDGETWIVFNGEIYNHVEVRSDLQALGHVFTTRTDTEVLLHAYLEWGEDCLDRLEGMYAFAIWDGRRGRLFCARDRLGIKPFYYATPGGYFIFASEIKALAAFPGCDLRADDEAVVGFLAHGNCDYAERTMFRDIRALPAAHCLTLDVGDGRISAGRYWTLEPRDSAQPSDAQRIDELRELLIASMRRHLISDVPAGTCLSGGLDSSTVVGLIRQVRRESPEAAGAVGEHLYTFTSCYDNENKALDEREYALDVARFADARPHLVFPSAQDFWADFQRLAWHQDMPFGSLSFYAQWCVMRAAKEAGVKVLLDGQGGDEVFGGYAKFRYAYLASLLRSAQIGRMANEVVQMVRQGDAYVLNVRNGFRYLPARVRHRLRLDSLLELVVLADWNRALTGESTPATRWWRNATGRTRGASPWTMMQRVQLDDITVDTLPSLLRMEDRSSMAFSIEARVPLLDHKVVELGVSLPDHLKVNHGWSKYAIRQAIAGMVPEAVRLRKTKLGFAAPDRRWIATDLRPQIAELLNGELRCGRYLDVAELRRWHRSARSAQANAESYLGLFRILSLEMWMRAFTL